MPMKMINSIQVMVENLILSSKPRLLEGLITGDTIEAVNQSRDNAVTFIGKVLEGVEEGIASGKVPAGAPAMTSPDLLRRIVMVFSRSRG